MKHKLANMPGWQRILQHRFYHTHLATPDFAGHITLYCIDALRAPLVKNYFNRPVCIADDGYSWLKQFPDGEPYTVTAHFDAQGQVALWYIDMVLQTGVDEGGIPWADDLYLDLVVSPAMEVQVKDADELLSARQSGEITATEYDLAWSTANRLMDQVARRKLALLALCERQRQMLLNTIPVQG